MNEPPLLKALRLPLLYGGIFVLLLGSERTGLAQEATLQARVANFKGAGQFEVWGRAPDLPDETVLHLTLSVKGCTPPIEVAFMRTTLKATRFAARHPDLKRRLFAPLTYDVRLELLMSQQPPPVRKWFAAEFGLDAQARVVLDAKVISVGTARERAAFTRASLEAIRAFTRRADALRLDALRATEQPREKDLDEWSAAYARLKGALTSLQRDFKRHTRRYVRWAEEQNMTRLQTLVSDLYRCLRDHERGGFPEGHKNLKLLSHGVERILSDVSGKLLEEAPDGASGAPKVAPGQRGR